MDVIIPTNLVCVHFDNAVPTSSFNFIQLFSTCFIIIAASYSLGFKHCMHVCMHVASNYKRVKVYNKNAYSMVVHILRVEKKPLSFHDRRKLPSGS